MRRSLLLLGACLAVHGHDIITTSVTWDRDISRMVLAHCASCHRPGGTIFSLITYADARPWAEAIKEETQGLRMPPWGAVKGGSVDFRNDNGLALEEMERIVSWADGGAPEGDAKDLPTKFEIPAAPNFKHPKGELVASSDFTLTKAFTLGGLWPRKVPENASIQISAELPDGTVATLVWLNEYKERFEHPFLLGRPLKLPARTVIRGIPAGTTIGLLPVTKSPATTPAQAPAH